MLFKEIHNFQLLSVLEHPLYKAFLVRLSQKWRNLMPNKTANFVAEDISSLDEMKLLPSSLPSCHPEYRPPTPEEVDALIKLAGWSQRHTALITGVNCNEKGSPTVRRWKTHAESKEHRAIPYGAWRLLLEYAEVATTEETREALKKYC